MSSLDIWSDGWHKAIVVDVEEAEVDVADPKVQDAEEEKQQLALPRLQTMTPDG